MKIIDTRCLTTAEKENILKLWNEEYPEKLKHPNLGDFESYLDGLADQQHFLLTNDSDEILGWSFTFVREGEKWFAIILDNNIHGLGYGKLLLNKLKDKEVKLNGWVIDHNRDKKQNGEDYKSPLSFYLKNDFIVSPGARLELNKISAVKIEWIK